MKCIGTVHLGVPTEKKVDGKGHSLDPMHSKTCCWVPSSPPRSLRRHLDVSQPGLPPDAFVGIHRGWTQSSARMFFFPADGSDAGWGIRSQEGWEQDEEIRTLVTISVRCDHLQCCQLSKMMKL